LIYLSYCLQILYKYVVAFKRFLIFTKRQNSNYLLVTQAHSAYVMSTLVYVIINKLTTNVLWKEDRILIKVIRIEKGYGDKKIIAKFSKKNWSIILVNLPVASDWFDWVSRPWRYHLNTTDWGMTNQSIIDRAVSQWRQRVQRLHSCIRENRHLEVWTSNLNVHLIKSEQIVLYIRTFRCWFLHNAMKFLCKRRPAWWLGDQLDGFTYLVACHC